MGRVASVWRLRRPGPGRVVTALEGLDAQGRWLWTLSAGDDDGQVGPVNAVGAELGEDDGAGHQRGQSLDDVVVALVAHHQSCGPAEGVDHDLHGRCRDVLGCRGSRDTFHDLVERRDLSGLGSAPLRVEQPFTCHACGPGQPLEQLAGRS